MGTYLKRLPRREYLLIIGSQRIGTYRDTQSAINSAAWHRRQRRTSDPWPGFKVYREPDQGPIHLVHEERGA